MKILVVIVTYNAMKWVDCCLGSLRASNLKPDMFIVDNGSTDGTQDYIRKKYPEAIFIQSKGNVGFGRANNLGLQYAKDNDYENVYLLNQDAWIFPDTLERLVNISKRNPEYGILSPFQMEANLKHIDGVFKKDVCGWQSSPDLLDDVYLQKGKDVINVSFVMAAHWFITRECLLKVGGFSPTFPHYGEDMNYIHRALFWKFKIGVVPSLQVVHDRENRPTNKKKKVYLKYIFNLVSLSNPTVQVGPTLFRITYSSFRQIITFYSFIPIWNLIKTFINYSKIRSNRIISTQINGAFLK